VVLTCKACYVSFVLGEGEGVGRGRCGGGSLCTSEACIHQRPFVVYLIWGRGWCRPPSGFALMGVLVSSVRPRVGAVAGSAALSWVTLQACLTVLYSCVGVWQALRLERRAHFRRA